ncbi:hypothetical protein [Alteromonas gracilis]|uniref:hypothetical protein n=1 Tax=Alteromonas gracilis TaxID=1479524 RepID=UPI002FE2A01E
MFLKKTLVCFTFCLFIDIAAARPIEILINGDFEAGDLTGWSQSLPSAPSIEWGVTSGAAIGAYSLASSDGTRFASPWVEGPNPSITTLFQIVDLNALQVDLTNTFTFGAEAIFAEDKISLGYQLFDSNQQLLFTNTLFSGSGGTRPNTTRISQSFSFVSGTQYISFFATGELLSGSYIDSGFDRASILVHVKPQASATSPNSISFLLSALVLFLSCRQLRKTKGSISSLDCSPESQVLISP